jgi:hypothetical protein
MMNEPASMWRGAAACAILAILASVSCDGGASGGVMQPPPPPLGPTLESLQANIFTPKCALSGCHAGSTPQQGMNLSDGATYSNVVNVASAEVALDRVVPGDAATSYLYWKVIGDPQIIGDRMPFGRPALSAAETDAIRDWIDAGAPETP